MPSSYKASSYVAVSQWQDVTKVKYAANPKSGKSKERYEKYAKAKTLAQALEFGSKPEDLLFDYEHGHLTVLGPFRKKPLLLADVKDFSELTFTDLVLSRFTCRVDIGGGALKKGEQERISGRLEESLRAARANMKKVRKFCIAGKFGLKDVDDLKNQGCHETPEMFAQRSVAERESQNVLEVCEKEGRKVSDHEVLRVLRLWGFRQNELRRNVMRPGQTFVYSDTVGTCADRTGLILVKEEARLYSGFARLLNQWLRDHLPSDLGADFVWTSININKNYAGRLHRDGSNVGPSFIKSFGDFSGGSLNYYPEDDRAVKLDELPGAAHDKVKVDVSKGLMLFDGNRAHEVDSFKGERYSLVYFTAPRFWKLAAADQKKCVERGFRYPTKRAIQALWGTVKAPEGYKKLTLAQKLKLQAMAKKRGKTLSTKGQASYRFWSHETAEKKKLEAAAVKYWKNRKPPQIAEGQSLETVEKLTQKRKAEEEPWSSTQQMTIGADLKKGKQFFFKGPKNIVDAADLLNAGSPQAPKSCLKEGICAVFSNRTLVYYAMYQDGLRDTAAKAFGIADTYFKTSRSSMNRSKCLKGGA